MRKTYVIVGCVLLVIFLLSSALILGRPPTDRPKISVALLGYTNDFTGSRVAAFAVTNLGQTTLRRDAGYWIQSPGANPRNGDNISWNVFTAGKKSELQPGESETLLVMPPANQASWRISLTVSYPESLANKVVRESLDWLNLSRQAFAFRSEWIEQ